MHGNINSSPGGRQTRRRLAYDEMGMRRPDVPGEWQLRRGEISYDAYRWGRWRADLSTFDYDVDRLLDHVSRKHWAGPQCLRQLRELLGRAA
jgi:hypothetical protein